MNFKLTEEINYHILANLGVLPSSFVSVNSTRSMIDKSFLLPDKIDFQIDNQEISKNVYGAQIMITGDKEFKLLLVDSSQDPEVPEYGLLVQMQGAPAFGVYLVFNRLVPDQHIASEAIIGVMSEGHWIPCSIYLQATFLAGMEQLRDLCVKWEPVKSYSDQFKNLVSFIEFHGNFFGDDDEG